MAANYYTTEQDNVEQQVLAYRKEFLIHELCTKRLEE